MLTFSLGLPLNTRLKLSGLLSLLILVATQLGCSSYKVKRDVVFKTVGGTELKLDFFSPETQGPHPAVVVVHGGGWKNRSGDMENVCKHLAKAGYIAVNTTYRLAPKALYPAAVEDVRDAIQWVHGHASEYDIDANRVSGWGYSAGANLILLAGLDPAMKLRSIVSGGTPAKLVVWPDSPLVNNFIGHSITDRRDLWEAASPVNYVKKNSPPVFLYHGAWDKLVEPNQVQFMTDALKAQGVKTESYLAPAQGHITTYFFSGESVERGIRFIGENSK